MRISIDINTKREGWRQALDAVCAKLLFYGAEIFIPENIVSSHEIKVPYSVCEKNTYEQSDFIISVGGDGTIMKSAIAGMKGNTPVIGINFGRLGYLAELELDEISHIGDILAGRFAVDERMLLSARVRRSGQVISETTALNDIVVGRGTFSSLIKLNVSVDGLFITKYYADGMIISTPTGSTAYSLSAGGPIVSPNIKCMLLTPICSHTLENRSLVLDAESTVKIEGFDADKEVYLIADGNYSVRIEPEDTVEITKHSQSVRFARVKNRSFYEILHSKFQNAKEA